MSSSLHRLLTDEGFERGISPSSSGQNHKKKTKQVRFKERTSALPENGSIVLPIHICRSRRSFDTSRPKVRSVNSNKGSSISVTSSKRGGSDSGKSKNSLSFSRMEEPAMDEVATRAVISILSGYVGKFSKDLSFRESVREKCYLCFARDGTRDSSNGILTSLELGIESSEKLLICPSGMWTDTFTNSIRLLTVVASLNSNAKGSTCGTPNTHLSACAQLYLSIVYKMEKDDVMSTRHLLQVFCDDPFLARTHLLPELWEHFFLPHLLHLKIWYGKEVESLSDFYNDTDTAMRSLKKFYNEQMDKGTTLFALYYKEWISVGPQKAPHAPSVPLPSKRSHVSSRRGSLDSSATHSSINKSLYQTVFGHNLDPSLEFDEMNRRAMNEWDIETAEKTCENHRTPNHRRHSKSESKAQNRKPEYMRLFPCQSEPAETVSYSSSTRRTRNTHQIPGDVANAISTICSSNNLNECEICIRLIIKAWLNNINGNSSLENAISKVPVIEGMLEVLFASSCDEVLELTVSLLAELITRNETIRFIILNSDPQLEIFSKLLRSTSLFLKAAVLLYLVKPNAKQMISSEWVPLFLRVLEFGDQSQTLFSVKSSPQEAAYYFLDQLLTGFDEDKNFENARQIVSVGGLNLLVKRVDLGDTNEKNRATCIILCCTRADGSCRHFLAKNVNKSAILQLLLLGNQIFQSHALTILTELLCLNRTTEKTKFLHGLLSGCCNLNTMHILFIYLRKARIEERPIVASLMLQLDFLGDPLQCSVYRKEAVDALVEALDCRVCNEKVQEQSARALSLLEGHFTYAGEANAEQWLLRQAGFDFDSGDLSHRKDYFISDMLHTNEEDEALQKWQRKTATALISWGSNRFLAALCDSISNGIPCLARASMVTISWMSGFLHSISNRDVKAMWCSTLIPRLAQSLTRDKALVERVLASLSLLSVVKTADYAERIFPMSKDLMESLSELLPLTWTAKELISILTQRYDSHK